MPCRTRTILSLDFTASDVDLLFDTLKELKAICASQGLSSDQAIRKFAEEIVRTGKVRVVAGYEHLVDAVKRRYAEKAVTKAAAKYGWKIQAQGETRMTLRR